MITYYFYLILLKDDWLIIKKIIFAVHQPASIKALGHTDISEPYLQHMYFPWYFFTNIEQVENISEEWR